MLYDEQTQLSSRRVAGNGALPSKQESPAHECGGSFHPSLKGRALEGNKIESDGGTQKYFRPDPHP
jgi:hypothetical protein